MRFLFSISLALLAALPATLAAPAPEPAQMIVIGDAQDWAAKPALKDFECPETYVSHTNPDHFEKTTC
jgi:hypothetical protein